MVNKHGLIMRGLKEACGETKRLYPYSGYEVLLWYHRDSGEIGFSFETQGTWINFDDPQIICLPDALRPMTMQEIADRIWERLSEVEQNEQLYQNYEAYFSDPA